jgi:thioredoxin-like negative regulator of GroEL
MLFIDVTPENAPTFVEQAQQGTWVVCHHMKGCIHCMMLRPTWDAARAAVKGVKDLNVADVEMGVMSLLPKSMTHVAGFPTIVVYKNAKPVKEFTGSRTKEDLVAFLKENAGAKTRSAPAPAKAPAKAERRAQSAPAAQRRPTPAAQKKRK